MAGRRAKLASYQELLQADVVDLKKLRELCFQGCPDQDGIRATCWKLLFGYLPPETKLWESLLKGQRDVYHQLLDEVLVGPQLLPDCKAEEKAIDHPLNPNPESSWNRYFKDNEILIQIDHDTRRLYPDFSFFQLATPYPRMKYNASAVIDIDNLKERVDRSCLLSQQVSTSRSGIKNVIVRKKKASAEPPSNIRPGEEAHWEVVERILFIYAKTNKGIGYVQGMNEIIGPIYYVFAQNPDTAWKEHAEADTFFCFTALMAEIGDMFTKKLDRSQAGIGGIMSRLMKLLEKEDAELHKHLVGVGIDPAFFGFRWLTLLLSQEFLLPEVICIWDTLFADERRFKFLIHFCSAMIISIREELLAGDFSECLKLLQNYPVSDTQKLILRAMHIQRRNPKM